MPKYKGWIVTKFYQKVEVEADNAEDAQIWMCEQSDIHKATDIDVDVYDMEEVK